MKPQMKFRGKFDRSERGLWVPEHPGSVKGYVSNLAVYDDFNPQTGKGKLLHFDPEVRENTISSGASWNILADLFGRYDMFSNADYTQRYQDANGYYFPTIRDCINQPSTASNTEYTSASTTFGRIAGIKGGSAGLASHQTVITNATYAWAFANAQVGYDWLNVTTENTLFGNIAPTSTATTISGSISNQKSGVPNFSHNITVTSTSSATAYTIDSVVWTPSPLSGASDFVPTASNTNGSIGPRSLSTSSSAGVGNFAANCSSPVAVNIYVSALFVLPYLITVNPSGAFQFTYTFQGA